MSEAEATTTAAAQGSEQSLVAAEPQPFKFTFRIDHDIPIPARSGWAPAHAWAIEFDKMQAGDSLFIPTGYWIAKAKGRPLDVVTTFSWQKQTMGTVFYHWRRRDPPAMASAW